MESDKARISRIIKNMKKGRYSHIFWKDKQQALIDTGLPTVQYVGDVEHHIEQIKIYDEVINELENRCITKSK